MRLGCAFGVLLWSSMAFASDGLLIKTGFITGNQYRALSQDAQRRYAIGVVDGIFLSPFFGASKEKLSPIESCLTGMQDDQVAAVISKFLAENPERWHESMNVLVYLALKGACEK